MGPPGPSPCYGTVSSKRKYRSRPQKLNKTFTTIPLKSILKQRKFNSKCKVDFNYFVKAKTILRHHGRWIDSNWKSRSDADALKENPINLTFS